MAGAMVSGFALPSPGVTADNPPGLQEALWAVPGSVGALTASYFYGAHRDRERGIVRG